MSKLNSNTEIIECKNYAATVLKNLKNLYQNDEFCDFTLSADGKQIKVHKILLIATSEYFRLMFRSSMRESLEESVELGGLNANCLQIIVEFLYSGQMNLNCENLHDILDASNLLQIETALDLCSDFLISLLNFSNADEYISIADKYYLTKVINFYTEKLLKEFDQFSHCAFFLGLPAEQLHTYLLDDRLRIRSEQHLLDCITRWFSHENESRAAKIPLLLSAVRYSLFSKQQLKDGHNLFSIFPANRPLLQKGIRYHQEVGSRHPLIGLDCQVRAEEKSMVFVHHGSSPRPFEILGYDRKANRFYQMATEESVSRDCRVVEVDDFIFVLRVVDSGGGTLVNGLLRFDSRHLTLSMLPPCRHLRIDPAVVAYNKTIYSFGGFIDVPQGQFGNTILNSVELYDIEKTTWSEVAKMPNPTHSHAACVYQSNIIIAGGITTASQTQATALVYYYNVDTNDYTQRASLNVPRRLHQMVVVGENVYVLGGIGTHSYNTHNMQVSIERYNDEANQWTILASSTLAGRSIGHFVANGNDIYSLGREHQQAAEDDIWQYDVVTGRWRTFAKMPGKMSLSSTSVVMLHVNFFDEKYSKKKKVPTATLR